MRPLAVLSAFLDVSSLNLAAPQGPPFFFCARDIKPETKSRRMSSAVHGLACLILASFWRD
jgi:hypothetical protein